MSWITLSLIGLAVVVIALALMFAFDWPFLWLLMCAGAALVIIPWALAVLHLLSIAIQKGAGQ